MKNICIDIIKELHNSNFITTYDGDNKNVLFGHECEHCGKYFEGIKLNFFCDNCSKMYRVQI